LWLVCITLALCVTGALSRIDNVIYDTAQQNLDRSIPSDVVLVTIDEQSLTSLGRWPWSRRAHAQLIDRLHAGGAKAIGFDVMFSEPQNEDLVADRLLAEAMARAGNVVLPVVIEKVRSNGQLVETLPLPELAQHAAALGRVHAELDADAIARSITLWEGLDQPVWPHFAQAMLSVAGQLPDAFSRHGPRTAGLGAAVLTKHDQRYINFSTAKRHLPSVSYRQVLRGEFSPDTFRDKLVLVGATASGMADSLPTPVSGFRQPMPGVEFLANAMVSIRSQTLITSVPMWLSSLLACALALVPMLWLPYTRTRTGLLANIAFAALVLAVTMALPLWWCVWVPLSAGLLGLLCAYPIWSWRKLESASQFLDSELSRLQHELGNVGHAAQGLDVQALHPDADPFQRRIDQVRAATAELKHLDQTQRETLAFVSHDIRVPLASAAAQIKKDLGEDHPAHKQMVRALAWTEDFLQTSRAQMLRADGFAELDLIALLHEVADDIYPLALVSSLTLALDLPDEPVWIQGNFETLSRAIANLLSNALKFSPPGGFIRLSAKLSGRQVQIGITDQGPGIALQDIDRLFKRFSRLEPTTANLQTGVGLGLYFVQTTVHKHGGTVKVNSRPGETTFSVNLVI
jgi:CHASE2 domain-containing sensor protein/anti-sigma regulatory factor (Ser/Thr protein kinase)